MLDVKTLFPDVVPFAEGTWVDEQGKEIERLYWGTILPWQYLPSMFSQSQLWWRLVAEEFAQRGVLSEEQKLFMLTAFFVVHGWRWADKQQQAVKPWSQAT